MHGDGCGAVRRGRPAAPARGDHHACCCCAGFGGGDLCGEWPVAIWLGTPMLARRLAAAGPSAIGAGRDIGVPMKTRPAAGRVFWDGGVKIDAPVHEALHMPKEWGSQQRTSVWNNGMWNSSAHCGIAL